MDDKDRKQEKPLSLEKAFERLYSLLGEDEGIIRELIHDFLEEYPLQLAKIKRVILDEEFESLEKISHGFKGVLLNFHLTAAFEISQRLEKSAREKNSRVAMDTVCELENEMEKFRKFCRQFDLRK